MEEVCQIVREIKTIDCLGLKNGNTNMRRGFHHPATITVKIAMHFSLVDFLNVVMSRQCYE
jgi:hypothetical protein